jgi:hypothetical protein
MKPRPPEQEAGILLTQPEQCKYITLPLLSYKSLFLEMISDYECFLLIFV